MLGCATNAHQHTHTHNMDGLFHAINTNDWDTFYSESTIMLNPQTINLPNSQDWTPVLLAAYCGRTRMVHHLASLGANLNLADKNGWTSLHVAAHQGRASTIRALLNHLKANNGINKGNKNGATAMFMAGRYRMCVCIVFPTYPIQSWLQSCLKLLVSPSSAKWSY